MINKIVSALMNWLVASVIVPLSALIIDYFRMKKTIKQLNLDIEALKKAQTIKEKEDASDHVP